MTAAAVARGSAGWTRWTLAAIALAALAAALPALPATWASVTAPSAVTDHASAGGGTLTVTECTRGFLLADWQCRGTFAYADPMAQGSQSFTRVVLANDSRYYDQGAQVGASLQARTQRAYLWGTRYVAGVMVLVFGLVWCAFAAWMLLLTRRRPGTLPISAVLVAGMACLYPTVAGLWY